jgi:hypothetical protein
MRADLAARLRRTMRGEAIAENGVMGVSGVTGALGLHLKPQQLRQLRQLRLEKDDWGKSAKEGVTSLATPSIGRDFDAIEERAALAAESVPACYLDAWARLQCQRPSYAPEEAWQRAIDDAGRFLDACGDEAADAEWTPGELFDAMTGLVWRLAGERVEAIGADHVRLSDGRTILRTEIRGRK